MTEGKREERIEERPYPTHHLPPYVALLLYPLLTLAPYCHSRWSLLTVTSDERSEETSDGGATGLVNEENLSHQSLHLLPSFTSVLRSLRFLRLEVKEW